MLRATTSGFTHRLRVRCQNRRRRRTPPDGAVPARRRRHRAATPQPDTLLSSSRRSLQVFGSSSAMPVHPTAAEPSASTPAGPGGGAIGDVTAAYKLSDDCLLLLGWLDGRVPA